MKDTFISSHEETRQGVRWKIMKYLREGKPYVKNYKWCTCNGGSFKLESEYFE